MAATSISAPFAPLRDPRVERTREHRLVDIVTIALCAVLCGADDWVAVETCGRGKEPWLRTFLALPGGVPSHDTCGRVFARLDPEESQQCFLAWVRAVTGAVVAPAAAGAAVAVDGKTLRRSHDRANGRAALHLVSAWASASGLVLGQGAVREESNEITAIPALLRLLALEGCTVTIDAMGCQTAIAAAIVARGADDVLALKDNHPTLRGEVEAAFADARATAFAGRAPADHDAARTLEKGHGRIEARRCWTISDPALIAYLDPAGAWAGLRTLALVEAERRTGATVSVEARYYLSSLPGGAAALARAVRAPWGVENALHWVLDVAFREDDSRVRTGHAPQNLAVLRHRALNLLRQERAGRGSIAAKPFRAALDPTYLRTILDGLHA